METLDNILIKAAKIWKELTEYNYVLTYGYKGKLETITITFSTGDFPHLAGFQYMKDVKMPKYHSTLVINKILANKILYKTITKSAYYTEMMKPRLETLIQAKNIFDNEFNLFSFIPELYPFTTTITADYLIASNINLSSYIFIIHTKILKNKCYLCCSAFTKGDRDYALNQRKRTLLRKERIHLPTKTVTILYDKLIEQKNSV